MNDRIAVIGAGILGLAVGARLAARGEQVVVVEKEPDLARHQTGRNSGVVHSGLYYQPGSLKATLCVEGRSRMLQFAAARGVDHDVCGKLVVATNPAQLTQLRALRERAAANGVEVEELDARGAQEIEPAVSCLAALHVPGTAVIDYAQVCRRLASDIEEAGGRIMLNAPVHDLRRAGDGWKVDAGETTLSVDGVVACAGLHADRVARMAGLDPGVSILPFRGEYYTLGGPVAEKVRTLVYPVPDPRLPFLGVHVTRGIDGVVHAGPNAVLAGSREGYRWRDATVTDLRDLARWSGTWRLARRFWRAGLTEVRRSASKSSFARDAALLVPGIEPNHLRRAPAGVRAQAVDRNGVLVDDFVIRSAPRQVHVVNAPSPAATSAFPIAEHIVDRWDEVSA